MLPRPLLISLFILPLVATPAYTQSRQTPPSSQGVSEPAALRTPQNLRAAISAVGLNRPTRDLKFSKGPSDANIAQFSQLVLGPATGTRATLDNLTITRDATPGPNLGTVGIEGRNLTLPNGMRVGRFTLSDVRGQGNVLAIVSSLLTVGANIDGALSADTISLYEITSNSGSGASVTSAQIGQIDLSQVSLNEAAPSFDALNIKNSTISTKDFTGKLADFQVSGISPDTFRAFTALGSGSQPPMDFLKLSLNSMALNGIEIELKEKANSSQGSARFSLASLRFEAMKDAMLGQFKLADMAFSGSVGRQTISGGLARLNMGGVNLAYFAKLGEAIQGLAKSARSQSAPTSFASSDQTTGVASGPSGGLSAPMSDVLKGGPLDGGIDSLDFGDFKISVAGFDFTIDQIGLANVKNTNNIITQSQFAPATLRLQLPDSFLASENPFGDVLKPLLTGNALTLRFAGEANFEPSTDVTSLTKYEVEMVNFGKLDMGFSASGFSKMLSRVSLDDLVKASLPPSRAGAPSARRTFGDLKPLLEIYKDIKIIGARAEVIDSGGLVVAAQMTGLRMQSSRQASTPASTQTGETRAKWGQTARAIAGDKKQMPIARSAALSFARWAETGGSMLFEVNPAAPIGVSDLENFIQTQASQTSLSQWGLRVSHQPPPSARR